eukprot:TRINITY_DN15274_c0_g1_i1.p1 TRINITY_DN15274_c0_g1~~TRINITY_DN15274_c0_g1_i1.p1  ORF type:complete len:346 (-),score=58.63 TRINITY_DN15274_c0_g1_i1:109-1122(-)
MTRSKAAHFTSIAYSADGKCVLAADKTRFVCIYEIEHRILIRQIQISHNRSLDGIVDHYDYRRETEWGPIDTMDFSDEDDDDDEQKKSRFDTSLPGVTSGKFKMANNRKAIEVFDIKFSPSSRQWACCTTEGMAIYSLDGQVTGQALFDPYQLDLDITTKSVIDTLNEKQYLKALIMSLRLNEDSITSQVFESIPYDHIKLLSAEIHENYLIRLVGFISRYMSKPVASPQVHFTSLWVNCILNTHGQFFKNNSTAVAIPFRVFQKYFIKTQEDLSTMCNTNTATLTYLSNTESQREINFGTKTTKTLTTINKHNKNTEQNEQEEDDSDENTNLPGWG